MMRGRSLHETKAKKSHSVHDTLLRAIWSVDDGVLRGTRDIRGFQSDSQAGCGCARPTATKLPEMASVKGSGGVETIKLAGERTNP